jgi:hypothetical protein
MIPTGRRFAESCLNGAIERSGTDAASGKWRTRAMPWRMKHVCRKRPLFSLEMEMSSEHQERHRISRKKMTGGKDRKEKYE